MIIGKFGKDLVFEVYAKPDDQTGDKEKDDKIKFFSFENFHRDVKNRTTEHARFMMKPKTQFDGPDLSDVTFTVHLSSSLCVNPREMIRKIEFCVRLGKMDYIVIGTKKIGKHKYLITHASEEWECIIKNGKLISANVDLTLKEYL